MKLSQYFLPTTKEVPAESTLTSHILMLRAGLVRKVGAGLYSYLPAGLKTLKKIEEIIRQEMNKTGALEFSMPFLIPQSLLNKTQRWEVFKKELYTLKDHKNNEYALSPTNEENFADLAAKELISHKQFPQNFYQIKTKFRDEIRPRYGVMRAREFVMKDAYSFHLNDKSLNETYQKMRKAYLNAFQKMGLTIACVKASSGAMGGDCSEEFMVPSDVGEETIISCSQCDYAANVETAVAKIEPFSGDFFGENPNQNEQKETQLIATPNTKTIEDLAKTLKVSEKNFIKTMVYEKISQESEKKTTENSICIILIRGDYQINDTKLEKVLPEYKPASTPNIVQIFGCEPGYLSPYGLEKKYPQLRIIADKSLYGSASMIAGANKKGYHVSGVNIKKIEESFENFSFADVYLTEKGHLCQQCSGSLESFKGIEVGHIFKLGQRYTTAFGHLVQDETGAKITPTMGCYGIGVSRCLAAVIEKNHDQFGIVFPLTVAPFEIALISLSEDDEVLETSKIIYQQLSQAGFETLWDDRPLRPGVKFQDQDLLGCPYQIICSKKNMAEKTLELKNRRTNERTMIPLKKIVETMQKIKENKENIS